MNRRTLVPIVAVAGLLGAAACSSDSSPTGPGLTPSADASFQTEVTNDLAPTAGEDAATDYEFASEASATGTSGISFDIASPAVSPSVGAGASAALNAPGGTESVWISPSCTFDATSGRFTCPAVVRKGHTFTVSYMLMDASGVTQSKFDKVTTASINFIVRDTAAISLSNNGNTFADTASRSRNMTVSGLAGDPDTVHTWNGYGAGSVRSVASGQITKVYQMASTDTVTALRIKQPRDINPYPLSGTIVRNYAITRTREASDTVSRSASRRVVVTFNGTANVPMVITRADGTTATFSLNLDTHKVTKP